jgi:hypothetical protein
MADGLGLVRRFDNGVTSVGAFCAGEALKGEL